MSLGAVATLPLLPGGALHYCPGPVSRAPPSPRLPPLLAGAFRRFDCLWALANLLCWVHHGRRVRLAHHNPGRGGSFHVRLPGPVPQRCIRGRELGGSKGLESKDWRATKRVSDCKRTVGCTPTPNHGLQTAVVLQLAAHLGTFVAKRVQRGRGAGRAGCGRRAASRTWREAAELRQPRGSQLGVGVVPLPLGHLRTRVAAKNE